MIVISDWFYYSSQVNCNALHDASFALKTFFMTFL